MSGVMLCHKIRQSPVVRHGRLPRFQSLLWLVCMALLVGCGEGAPSGSSPTGQTAQQQSSNSGGAAYTVDMDAIFPQGAGRDLVLNNCQNCHTWVPIVILQMNELEWDRWAREHRQRVEGLTDAEFDTLLNYVKANFNPDTPVPELPPALLEAWTTY